MWCPVSIDRLDPGRFVSLSLALSLSFVLWVCRYPVVEPDQEVVVEYGG